MEVIDIKKNSFDKKITLSKNQDKTFIWLLHRPKRTTCRISFNLKDNARLQNIFLFAAGESDNFYIKMFVNHEGSGSSSRSVIRGILSDQSRVEVDGNVRVQKKARFSDSHFEGRALLFQDAGARIDPKLEILTDEVGRVTHAVTVSRIPAEELFYLASRGIDRPKAEILKVQGFLQAPFFNLDVECPDWIEDIVRPLIEKIHYV